MLCLYTVLAHKQVTVCLHMYTKITNEVMSHLQMYTYLNSVQMYTFKTVCDYVRLKIVQMNTFEQCVNVHI